MKGFVRERRTREDDADATRADGTHADGTHGLDANASPEQGTVDGLDDDFSNAELQEFLDADRYDVPADPAFKERLRDTLWRMVKRMRRDGTGSA